MICKPNVRGMDMDRERLTSLWRGYAQGTLRGEELEQFLQTLDDPALKDSIRAEIGELLSTASNAAPVDDIVEARIHERLTQALSKVTAEPQRRFLNQTYLLYAAALVLLVLTASWYVWMLGFANPAESEMMNQGQLVRKVPLAQASEYVTLTLGNGSRIPLDGVKDGTVAREGGTSVVKRRDGLIYGSGQTPTSAGLYHSIETPRGGRYQVNLSDGTRVWLNAASGIRFPVRFSGDTREVELTGQAYFEVVHDAGRPFIVKVGDARVEVYGTHFDVMNYQDDPEIRTTLLEGSVGFRSPGGLTMLRPGDQSKSGRGQTTVKIRTGLDVQEIIGWREGRLHFGGEDIGQVCRALSRAFDVRLEFDERIRESFYASFPEHGRLDVVLKALEMTGKVKFEKSGDGWRAVPHS
jgi:ferric-dicitrate binding protein FerR (iron transport regulator)